jgi:hypothetical protein
MDKRKLLPWLIGVLVVAAGLLVWLTGYTTAPADLADFYYRAADQETELVQAGSTVWLPPFSGGLVSLPRGWQEMSAPLTIQTADGELILECTLEVDLTAESGRELVARFGDEVDGGDPTPLLAAALETSAFSGTNRELYGPQRAALAAELEDELLDYVDEELPELVVERLSLPTAGLAEGSLFPGPGDAEPCRVVVLGIDALEDTLLEPLIEMGELPNFARLRDEGYLGVLRSEEPYFSPIVWTTFATGKPAAEHGVVAFTRLDPETGVKIPLSSNDRRVEAFWEFLGPHEKRSVTVNWYYSWPVGEIDGVCLTDLFWEKTYGRGVALEREFAELEGRLHPPQREAELKAVAESRPYISEDDYAYADVLEIVPRFAENVEEGVERFPLPNFLTHDILAANAFLHLLENEDWELAALYQDLQDKIPHSAWPAHARYWERLTGTPSHLPPLPEGLGELSDAMGPLVVESYRLADKLLGRVMKLVDDDTVILVISDHGFASLDPPREVPTSRYGSERMYFWHDPTGVVGLWGPHVRRGASGPEMTIYDFLPTVLALLGLPPAEDMPGRIHAEALEPDYLAWLEEYAFGEAPATYDSGRRREKIALPEAIGEQTMEQLRALGYLQ